MNIGVIGIGSIGIRHLNNLSDLRHTTLPYDPNVSMFNTSLGSLLEKSDAVVIASPTSLHFEHIIACLRAGKPCFAEKPLAATKHQVTCIRQLHPDPEFIKMVGYNLRFHSCVQQTRGWLPDIGRPLWARLVCAQYNDKPSYLRDGVILNWSHEIDLALHLLGPAEVVASATRAIHGHDDLTDIILRHEIGAQTTIHLDYLTQPEERGFVIAGDKGSIQANLVDRHAELKQKGYPTRVFRGNDSFDDNYRTEMAAFIARLNGEETVGCTTNEALAVMDVCLAVRKQAGLE